MYGESKLINERSRLRRYGERTLGALALSAATIGGGILATNVQPASGELYGVTVSSHISPDPTRFNSIYDKTEVGMVSAEFDPWGPTTVPGIEVTTEITPEVVENSNALQDIQKNPERYKREVTEFAVEQTKELALTFGVGSLATATMLGGAAAFSRRFHGSKAEKISVIGSGLAIGMAALPVGSLATYNTDNYRKLELTGFIAQGVNTPGIMSAISIRQAEELEPYLNGWLAMGSLAKNELSTPETDNNDDVQLLLVSDIHGNNVYPVIKQIIDEKQIDAVVDTGDLINFGRAGEVDLADMSNGIKSLGVPYLFVTGNHDTNSPTDDSLLNKLATLPNVHLLQPDDDTYTKTTVDGVNIIGMNDRARWYGDDGSDIKEKQLPYTKQLSATFKDSPNIDLVVAHNPTAINQIDFGAMRASGHTHQSGFDGNHISIGTFGGGDPFRAQDTKDGKTTKVTRPRSFSIISYDADCQPEDLLTYTYTMQKTPTLTSVETNSLRTNSQNQVQPERQCETGSGVTDTIVPAVKPVQ